LGEIVDNDCYYFVHIYITVLVHVLTICGKICVITVMHVRGLLLCECMYIIYIAYILRCVDQKGSMVLKQCIRIRKLLVARLIDVKLLLPEPWKNITVPVGCLLLEFTTLKFDNFKLITINGMKCYTQIVAFISHVSMLVTWSVR
jgi:hypothetical protein